MSECLANSIFPTIVLFTSRRFDKIFFRYLHLTVALMGVEIGLSRLERYGCIDFQQGRVGSVSSM